MNSTGRTLALPSPHSYVGGELNLFEKAVRWKSYFRRHLKRWIRGRVLEVGAGLGGTTRILCDGRQDSWTALEPDGELLAQLLRRQERQPYPVPVEAVQGNTADLGDRRFDCVLYIDVLEHIEDDAGELRRAAELLAPGGAVVVLSPAHQWLYTPFDKAIGHYRRYTRGDLRALTPSGVRLEKLFYLDSVGLLASLANLLVLKQAMPTAGQIRTWDRAFVPASRWLDPFLAYRAGKTVVGVCGDRTSRVGPARASRAPAHRERKSYPDNRCGGVWRDTRGPIAGAGGPVPAKRRAGPTLPRPRHGPLWERILTPLSC